MQSLLRPEFLLGATPCSVNSAGSSRGFRLQANSPRHGLGANLTSFGQNQGIAWSSDSSLWGNQVQKESLKVLDRTKALHGPRTQACGETKYKKKFLQVLDRTKALHGPRTQASGETNCLKGGTGLHGFSGFAPGSSTLKGLVWNGELRSQKHDRSHATLGQSLG